MTLTSSARPARTYKVNSLDRGLDVLRVIRQADRPMRNHDIVKSTGLPKATVSRLVNTLMVLGYLRRIDQGSYVPGHASGRTGRAMLGGLKLDQYANYFHDLVSKSGACVCLEMMVSGKMIPVYRWSASGSILLISGVDTNTAGSSLVAKCSSYLIGREDETAIPEDREAHSQLDTNGWCHEWNSQEKNLTICTAVQLGSVAKCLLALHVLQCDEPTMEEIHLKAKRLVEAATAITKESPQN